MTDPVARAREIADDLLFPHALEVDRGDSVPREHLDVLASAGLYGIAGPPEAGGLGVDLRTFLEVVEVLAGGCLSTAFVWIQHHGVVRAAASSATPGLRDRWLGPLCRGETRAGIALAGFLVGPPRITARRSVGTWTFSGTAPWVTGWGRIDVIQVAGRDEQDNVVSALVDARPAPGLTIEPPLELVAMSATATSPAHFAGVRVSDDRVTSVQPLAERRRQDHETLRVHAALALGVADRSVRLIGATTLEEEVRSVRARLERSAPQEVPAAKAAASELALRATAALVVATGSRSLLRTEHAQRLAREAMFLLVFGSRPAVRGALLEMLGPSGDR